MNRDDIIRMAVEAGWPISVLHPHGPHVDTSEYLLVPALERFADLVAAVEREACASVCEDEAEKWEGDDGPVSVEARLCAIAIRERTNHDQP